jgi:coenzyme F420-reducing hydrogenase gamma subunit
MGKPRVAVHKFSSCDGCQLAFLNAGERLLELARQVEFVHFAEAGVVNPEAEADIAFVEGSLTTADEIERIRAIRARSTYLVTIGACATAGGIQALRNGQMHGADWIGSVYAAPELIASLDVSAAIAAHVNVDLQLWGCPVSTQQVMQAVRDRLSGVKPKPVTDSVCLDCKRAGAACVLVTRGEPCMGPATRAGCGALCPQFGRACYGCFGPSEQPNGTALAERFAQLGLVPEAVRRRFLFITPGAEAFAAAAGEAPRE